MFFLKGTQTPHASQVLIWFFASNITHSIPLFFNGVSVGVFRAWCVHFFSEYFCPTNQKQWWICWLTNQRNHLSCETHHLWGASLRKRTPWMIILLKCIARGPWVFRDFPRLIGVLTRKLTYPTLWKKKLIFQTALAWDIYSSQEGISTYKRHHPTHFQPVLHLYPTAWLNWWWFVPRETPTISLDPSHIITSAVCSSRDMIGPCGLVQSSVLMDHFVPPSRFLSEWGVGVGKRV